MNKDNKLMMEALQSKFTGRGPVNDIVVSELHKMHTALNQMATMIDLNPSAEVDQLLSKIRDTADMLIADAPAENAEGLSDQEYHKARKDSFELPGEEIGNGPIKVRLNKDTRLDCYKSGTVQEVRFSKGTIFNCDENVGDYYECDTEEYGGIAVFPDDVTVLSGEENAENADERKERVQRGWDMNKKRWAKWKMENPEAAAKHAAKKAAGKEENAAIAISLQKAGKKPS